VPKRNRVQAAVPLQDLAGSLVSVRHQSLEFEEQQRQDWRSDVLGHEASEDTPRPAHDVEYALAILAAIRRDACTPSRNRETVD